MKTADNGQSDVALPSCSRCQGAGIIPVNGDPHTPGDCPACEGTGVMMPPRIPAGQRVLGQDELVEWWHSTDAPGAIKDAVSILLRHSLPAAQAVEMLHRGGGKSPEAASQRPTLYLRCRPRKGVTATPAGELLAAVMAGEKPELPNAVYTDDLEMAEALVEHFEVIVEGSR